MVDENAANGTSVGITAFAADADATNNTVTYELIDDAGGRFAIDPVTGQVTVADGIDREADGPSLDITVRATSDDGSIADRDFHDRHQRRRRVRRFDPVDVDNDVATTRSTRTQRSALRSASWLWASDADATNNTITYTLIDDAGGRFAIDLDTGVVTVAGRYRS